MATFHQYYHTEALLVTTHRKLGASPKRKLSGQIYLDYIKVTTSKHSTADLILVLTLEDNVETEQAAVSRY